MLRTLHDHWTLRPVAGPGTDWPGLRGSLSLTPGSSRDSAQVAAVGAIPATVPGTVHTDLLAAGLIPDPYLDSNERLLAWIGLTDWRYETTFDWTPDGHERTELSFDGLDTVARIELNGELLGQTFNMRRRYVFEVRHLLR